MEKVQEASGEGINGSFPYKIMNLKSEMTKYLFQTKIEENRPSMLLFFDKMEPMN